ncbi:MAG: PAS domain-containing protein [Candidatus Hydrogenedentes bacterium]|nr:PAS domain-containing protein [Candidatus Hydrogenedentota bacterium]
MAMEYKEKSGEYSVKSARLITREQIEVFDRYEDAVTITDAHGVILYVNRAFTELTKYSPEEILGKTPRVLKSGRHDGFFYKNMWARLLAGYVWQGEVINRKKDCTLYVNNVTITPFKDEAGQISHFIAVRQDVTRNWLVDQESRRRQESVEIPSQIEALANQASTKETLYQGVLRIVLSLSEFKGESRGVIFEADPAKRVLRLVATSGKFSKAFLEDEATVPFGQCLCGRAAIELKVLVCENCHTDARHENRWLGMGIHGHYTVPLISNKRLHGIMNLYSYAGICKEQNRYAMLSGIGKTIGEAICRIEDLTS